MSTKKRIKKAKALRAARVRKRLVRDNDLPRVSVFRSAKHMYAQAINDTEHKTLASSSTLELKETKGDKSVQAHAVGKALADRLQEKSVKKVIFDRGPYRYHGRVKALAEGLRAGGLEV